MLSAYLDLHNRRVLLIAKVKDLRQSHKPVDRYIAELQAVTREMLVMESEVQRERKAA